MNEEELNLDDLDSIQENAEKKLKVKNRFEQLSEKVILTSKEKEEALAKANQAEEARLKAERERDFYKDFSTNIAKYPNAAEYQDKIREKVQNGYQTEDAIISVLAKEGKLTTPPPPTPEITVEGGSAPTITEGAKSLADMTPEEKLAALAEADKAGELASALRGR